MIIIQWTLAIPGLWNAATSLLQPKVQARIDCPIFYMMELTLKSSHHAIPLTGQKMYYQQPFSCHFMPNITARSDEKGVVMQSFNLLCKIMQH